MTFHNSKWIEYKGFFYCKKPNAKKIYMIGRFSDKHRFDIVGGKPEQELPASVREKIKNPALKDGVSKQAQTSR